MADAISIARSQAETAVNVSLSGLGRAIFSFAIIALGVETLVCGWMAARHLGPDYQVIPVLPWLPVVPWIAYIVGALVVACGGQLLSARSPGIASLVLGSLLFLSTLILDVPRNAASIADIGLRTRVFEPLALACLAWLLPGRGKIPSFLERASRYLLGLSLVVFGVDHFLALAYIATLIPHWIPLHVFWVAIFGIAFIAAGLSVGLNFLERWGAGGIGLMFGIWVVTLHLPRVLGLYGIPGAPHNPNEWSSLFIAVALWGGLWTLASPSAS